MTFCEHYEVIRMSYIWSQYYPSINKQLIVLDILNVLGLNFLFFLTHYQIPNVRRRGMCHHKTLLLRLMNKNLVHVVGSNIITAAGKMLSRNEHGMEHCLKPRRINSTIKM